MYTFHEQQLQYTKGEKKRSIKRYNWSIHFEEGAVNYCNFQQHPNSIVLV